MLLMSSSTISLALHYILSIIFLKEEDPRNFDINFYKTERGVVATIKNVAGPALLL